jgi:hypothetical protein
MWFIKKIKLVLLKVYISIFKDELKIFIQKIIIKEL